MKIKKLIKKLLSIKIKFGTSPNCTKSNCIILFPDEPNTLRCGISALIAFKLPNKQDNIKEIFKKIDHILSLVEKNLLITSENKSKENAENLLEKLFQECTKLKLFHCSKNQGTLFSVLSKIDSMLEDQTIKNMSPDFKKAKTISRRLETLKDTSWCIKQEIIHNIQAIKNLSIKEKLSDSKIKTFKKINAVLNSIDKLEVRGRDSAGLSILFTFKKTEFEKFIKKIKQKSLKHTLNQRKNNLILTNNCININENQKHRTAISFVYKFAAEIGSLGDNIDFIRNQIKNDLILQMLFDYDFIDNSVLAHTRWASVGEINLENCHPLDNASKNTKKGSKSIINVCLNGDIDNYLEIKKEFEAKHDEIHKEINTDTKLIPLWIEHYLKLGNPIEKAFRLAVKDFEGSHAISMHTDLASNKIFLAQKGSGQAIFVGIGKDHYISASELYGIVEETDSYIKLNGEKKGQVLILDKNKDIEKLQSVYYDGNLAKYKKTDILKTQITSRDIDRQDFKHYFLKEIIESPNSFEKTLENKFELSTKTNQFFINQNKSKFFEKLEDDFKKDKIRHIYFIGQGTAGVAAKCCSNILNYYLENKNINISAKKSSELSGFFLDNSDDSKKDMSDTIVIAISQSGTTTDTNRAIDMVKNCNAKTIAVVNRKGSDLGSKTDEVVYTSSGRDIEMSVASTKAFYSQIAAGAFLGLTFASITHIRSKDFISKQIAEIKEIPLKMRTVLDMKDKIKDSAQKLAIEKKYWAVVGSGANKAAADEIRIKLSELCYKTISSDFVEDKKHIDLSSEPLIIICAAGTRQSVLTDIIKDAAVFHSHKAFVVAITTQNENQFKPYAKNVFKIPEIKEHFAPVLNTLVGHLWGYYAALAINKGSKFIYEQKKIIQEQLDNYTGQNIYEILFEKKFKESIAKFYIEFTKKRHNKEFTTDLDANIVSDITLLSKYLTGRLPIVDFELDFKKKGTPANILNLFLENLTLAINSLRRPVDAIKHQAKTVTVGTSRIKEKFEGIIFDTINTHNIEISKITNKNILVIKNLQEIIQKVHGTLLYQISGLNLLGEVTQETEIKVISKRGILKNKKSRVEKDKILKGTKNIIVREQNVYIGKGRKDKENILIIPIISSNPNTSNVTEHLLSFNISFKKANQVTLLKKIKALGEKYHRLKDWILESDNIEWSDNYLNLVKIKTLFGDTAETVVKKIRQKIK